MGDKMICPDDIATLKTDINDMIGQKIKIKGSAGRSKIFEKEVTIENTYSDYFRAKCEEEKGNGNYNCSYVEVLKGEIQLDVFNGTEYNPFILPIDRNKEQKNIV